MSILQLLEHYSDTSPAQAAFKERFLVLLSNEPECFRRTCYPGHITASSWIINSGNSQALLTHHRKLNKWIQLGGHADGDADVFNVTLREATEESGLSDLVLISPEIFDLDIHEIPARKDEPAHLHYDVRFLLGALGGSSIQISDESLDLRWFSYDELGEMQLDESVQRMVQKWRSVSL